MTLDNTPKISSYLKSNSYYIRFKILLPVMFQIKVTIDSY